MPDKNYAYLLNVEPSHLMFLKTYINEIDDIIITNTDQNGRPLKIEDKVNLILLNDKKKWNATQKACDVVAIYHFGLV